MVYGATGSLDIGEIFKHAFDRGEFVLSILNFNLRNRTAFKAGKQQASQTIANRRTEAAFKRFGDELAVGRGQGSRVASHNAGQL